jgi:hypothetical protein
MCSLARFKNKSIFFYSVKDAIACYIAAVVVVGKWEVVGLDLSVDMR